MASVLLKSASVLVGLCGFGMATATIGQTPAQTLRPPNRTLPKVTPPSTALAFSPAPTTAEIARARVFEEPLAPIGGEPAAAENAAIAAALTAYSKRTGPDDFAGLTSFLSAYPESPWRGALLTNLGKEYYNTGHYSLAIESWSQAWTLLKDAGDSRAKPFADLSGGELVYMYARLGRASELEAFFAAVADRTFVGSATERIAGAKQGLWGMRNAPGKAFRCGPLALDRIRAAGDPNKAGHPLIVGSESPPNGFALSTVAELSQKLGMDYQMAFRTPGTAMVAPAVIHWKVGHYAAIIRFEGGKYLLQDPTFGNDVWVTPATLDAEASGYFLIPPGPLPEGWRVVELHEGQSIFGKGETSNGEEGDTGDDSWTKDQNSCGGGMAVANAHLMLVSLNIVDTPIGYRPPVGAEVFNTITYNQREASQPATFTYSNFGPKWNFEWISFIKDNPNNPTFANVSYCPAGGGTRVFKGYNDATKTFAPPAKGKMKLVRTSSTSYELKFPDGTRKIFAQPDGATGSSRKVFLNQIIDPAGNVLDFIYDSNFRLIALADAIGQITTFSYENPKNSLLITKITDPFGRFALFDYDGVGRLVQITDVLGLRSQFTYGEGDFISSMTTPYGTTSFATGDDGNSKWLETTDPTGLIDRVEYLQSQAIGIPDSDPEAKLPQGMATRNSVLWARNTFYWDKITYASGAGDYAQAKLFHWQHSQNFESSVGTLESTKLPLENRVWYNYPGQPEGNEGATVEGSGDQPIKTGRVLDDGTTQIYLHEYNSLGKMTKAVDPLGRTTTYIYAANEIDLIEVRQSRNGSTDLLWSATYNDRHLPLTTTDAAGQTTTYTYNGRGQVLTITNAKNEVTTRGYNADGNLTSIDGALPGTDDTTTYTYDVAGRVQTVTRSDGYTLAYEYDLFDRLCKTTYPDDTFEELTYTKLDQTGRRDRAGRLTSYAYNPLRQLISVTDPLNRAIKYDWCKCGDLKRLIDPMGRATTWRHDIQGRKTAKQYPDGSTIQYLYENTTSRLKHQIDEKNQMKVFSYAADNSITSVEYPNAIVPTPSVSYVYDAEYPRVLVMMDGQGTTSYQYHPVQGVPSLGAGQLASIDGPWQQDVVNFHYDELGRVVVREINGIPRQATFDAAGRKVKETSALGESTFTYYGSTVRLSAVELPNGVETVYSYFGSEGDHRIRRIQHFKPDGTSASSLDYVYDSAQRIETLSLRRGTGIPAVEVFTYDAADQLKSVGVSTEDALFKSYVYSYDPCGNRVLERAGDNVAYVFSYNSLNQLTSTTKTLEESIYEWDAENRLVTIKNGGDVTEIEYNGFGRRVKVTEKANGSVSLTNCYLWSNWELCEKRDSSGEFVLTRYFPYGLEDANEEIGKVVYTQDYLGSTLEAIGQSGRVWEVSGFDPWGTRQVEDAAATPTTFARYWNHQLSGLMFSATRAYDPHVARWISRDIFPMAELLPEGPNLYAFAGNDPVNKMDPFGLACKPKPKDKPYEPPPKDACSANPISCFFSWVFGPVAPVDSPLP